MGFYLLQKCLNVGSVGRETRVLVYDYKSNFAFRVMNHRNHA